VLQLKLSVLQLSCAVSGSAAFKTAPDAAASGCACWAAGLEEGAVGPGLDAGRVTTMSVRRHGGREALYVSPRGVRVPSPNLGVQAELMRPARELDNGIGLGRMVYKGTQRVYDEMPFSCTRVWNPYGRWLGGYQPTQGGMTLEVTEASMPRSRRLPPANSTRTPAATTTAHRMSVLVGWGGDERAAGKGAGGHDLACSSPMLSWARDLRQASPPAPAPPPPCQHTRTPSLSPSLLPPSLPLPPSPSHAHTHAHAHTMSRCSWQQQSTSAQRPRGQAYTHTHTQTHTQTHMLHRYHISLRSRVLRDHHPVRH